MVMVMVQEHGFVLDGADAVGDTIVYTDMNGWDSPEQATEAALDRANSKERTRYRNGWEEREPAVGAEYAELQITQIWTRVWFEDRNVHAPDGTYWNGEPAIAQQVRVKVAVADDPHWWCAPFAGTVRDAVRVEYGHQVFFIDDEDGSGWAKVTTGHGSPRIGHRSLPNASKLVTTR